ncbi:hypothetical protein B9Z55_007323 [Caenorhabditis nigoni]|uniref:Uncharacterized protein n=1 Tax=Caenorhabditis nigoni TaxID=1611254 RepID=A0A2G5V976_9PELO|nr:hypothetical protein B9Z55_007323 [Caenorhabditis nigoni]
MISLDPFLSLDILLLIPISYFPFIKVTQSPSTSNKLSSKPNISRSQEHQKLRVSIDSESPEVEEKMAFEARIRQMEDEMIGLEGEIEFMQYHHDIAMEKLEKETQEARNGRRVAENRAKGYDEDFKRARTQLRGCQDELEKVNKSMEMLQERRKELEPQIKIGGGENVEKDKTELEEELKQMRSLYDSTKARVDELNSSLENERRSRNLEKAVHSHQKAEWDEEKKGYKQRADNFLDDMNKEYDLVKSLEKEKEILEMERDAEKKAKEELKSQLNEVQRKLEASEEKKQEEENVWKAQNEALEDQLREVQACLEQIKDIAQSPRIQALPAPFLPTAFSGMPAGQEQRNEDPSTSTTAATNTASTTSAPASQQEAPEEVQLDGTDDAQGADNQDGPSTAIGANKNGKRKCPRRGELLVETEPAARRQQPKVDYRGAQLRQEPSKKRK